MPGILDFIATNLPWTPIGRGILSARENAEMMKYRQMMMQRQQQEWDQQQQQTQAAQQAFKPGAPHPEQIPVTPQVGSPGYAQAKQQLDQTPTGTASAVDFLKGPQSQIAQALASAGQFNTAGQFLKENVPQAPVWREETVSGLPGQRNTQTGQFDPFPQQAQAADGVTIRELNVGDNIRYGRFNKAGDFLGYVSDQGGAQIGGPRASRDESGPQGPYAGLSIEAQDTNILLNGDPGSQQYAAAYARQAAERALPDGTRIKPDMRPYRQPTYGAYAEQGARAPGSASVTPAGVRQGRQMAITMGDMASNLKSVIAELKPADRAAFLTTGVVTPAMAKAQAAFNLFISQLRDPSILNTGVLQSGELAWINQMFPGPGSFSSLLQGNAPLVEALDEVNVLMRARRRSFDALDENAPQGATPPAPSGGNDQPPPGISPEEWAVMPPEDRALWQK